MYKDQKGLFENKGKEKVIGITMFQKCQFC